jgi:cysteine synthase A
MAAMSNLERTVISRAGAAAGSATFGSAGLGSHEAPAVASGALRLDESVTPLRELTIGGRKVFGKIEGVSASGSHKDRPARWLLRSLRQDGRLRPGAHLMVCSSEDFARAVAHHTLGDDVTLTVITDVLSPTKLIDPLRAYPHVRVIVVDQPDASGSHLQARMKLIAEMRAADPALLYVDQYDDTHVPQAYEHTLGPEMLLQTRGLLGAIFLPVNTGGTINGLIRHRRRLGGTWKIIAVDAEGSALFRPPIHGAVKSLSGYGNRRPTRLIGDVLHEIDFVTFVRDAEALAMCRRLSDTERLSVGPSSGAVLAAMHKVFTQRADMVSAHAAAIAILPDRGNDYPEVADLPSPQPSTRPADERHYDSVLA